MSNQEDSIKVALDVATKAAEIALKKFEESAKKTSDTWDIFKGNFGAELSVKALQTGFQKMQAFFGSFIDEASKAEQSVRNLEVSLANSGRYSAEASQGFQELGDSIERTTVYSGDQVEAAVAQLAALTGLTNEGITKATKASVDLAATLNVDLGTAVDMMTKAINGQMTAFNKIGISIKAGETSAENLSNVLAALSTQQGAAAKQADTYTGAMKINENMHGKLFEAVGKLLTQNPAYVKSIKASAQTFLTLSEWVERNADDITLFAESFGASIVIVGAAMLALKAYAVVAASASGALGLLEVAATTAWAAITGPVGLAVVAVVALGAAIFATVKYWNQIKVAAYSATAAILEYSAVGVSAFSKEGAENLRNKAKALREEAEALKQTTKETKENTDAVRNNTDAKLADYQKMLEKNAKDLQERIKLNASLAAVNADLNNQLEEAEIAHQNTMAEINQSYWGTLAEFQAANEMASLERRQQFERDQLQATIDAENARIAAIVDATERRNAAEDSANKYAVENSKLQAKQQIEIAKQRARSEDLIQRERIANQRSTLSTIASLSQSNNRALSIIGKAAGMAQIAIDTPVAISKALAAFPPPFNFAMAAAVGAAMAAQAAQLAGLNFATGGIVPGTSLSGDKVRANVNSREMILNQVQQKRLFDIADGKKSTATSSNDQTNALLVMLIDAVKSQTSVSIDGKEIFSVVKRQMDAGRKLS